MNPRFGVVFDSVGHHLELALRDVGKALELVRAVREKDPEYRQSYDAYLADLTDVHTGLRDVIDMLEPD